MTVSILEGDLGWIRFYPGAGYQTPHFIYSDSVYAYYYASTLGTGELAVFKSPIGEVVKTTETINTVTTITDSVGLGTVSGKTWLGCYVDKTNNRLVCLTSGTTTSAVFRTIDLDTMTTAIVSAGQPYFSTRATLKFIGPDKKAYAIHSTSTSSHKIICADYENFTFTEVVTSGLPDTVGTSSYETFLSEDLTKSIVWHNTDLLWYEVPIATGAAVSKDNTNINLTNSMRKQGDYVYTITTGSDFQVVKYSTNAVVFSDTLLTGGINSYRNIIADENFWVVTDSSSLEFINFNTGENVLTSLPSSENNPANNSYSNAPFTGSTNVLVGTAYNGYVYVYYYPLLGVN